MMAEQQTSLNVDSKSNSIGNEVTVKSVTTTKRVIKSLKLRWMNFCQTTYVQGFSELYKVKSSVWVWIWSVTILLSLTATSYQVILAASQYVQQSSSTNIQPVLAAEVLYPPIKICLSHWLDWVDMEKAKQLHLSYEGLLYGMSYLSPIYSNRTFNVNEAEMNFVQSFRKNNFTTLSEFYKAVATNASANVLAEASAESFHDEIKQMFTETEFCPCPYDNSLLFCYVATGDNILNGLAEMKATNSKLVELKKINEILLTFYDINQVNEDFQNVLTTNEEYTNYMKDWLAMTKWLINNRDSSLNEFYTFGVRDRPTLDLSANFTSFETPVYLFADAFQQKAIILSPEIDGCYITVKASVQRLLSTSGRCHEGQRSISTDMTCSRKCFADAEKDFMAPANFDANATKVFDHIFVVSGRDTLENLSKHKIYFLNDEVENVMDRIEAVYVKMNQTEIENQQYDNEDDYFDQIVMCDEKCKPGCEKWVYDYTVSTPSLKTHVRKFVEENSLNNFHVKIVYPSDGDTLMMTEFDSQTWEGFIANVGGLLGIWTGASVLSLLQLLYLCCCEEVEFERQEVLEKPSNVVEIASAKKSPVGIIDT